MQAIVVEQKQAKGLTGCGTFSAEEGTTNAVGAAMVIGLESRNLRLH
jgi:hypothetical protein